MTLGITTADGGGSTVNATAEPGIVTDVPLDDFPDGRYSFTISSTVPIVAGARTTRPTQDGATDLGWFASAEPLGDDVVTAVAPGSGARLNLVNPTREDAEVTIASGDDEQRVSVVSGDTVTVSPPTSTQLTITGASGIVAGSPTTTRTASPASRSARPRPCRHRSASTLTGGAPRCVPAAASASGAHQWR